MVYNDGDLTEEQAETIIGKKMMSRIKLINGWLKRHGFRVLIHSTQIDKIDSILGSGLTHFMEGDVIGDRFETTPDEILELTDVREDELRALGDWARKHKGTLGRLNKECKTSVGVTRDTTMARSSLSAKELLEYGHNDGVATVIMIVPRNPETFVKKEKPLNIMAAGFTRRKSPYLRAHVACKLEEGTLKFKMRNLYPTQGIIFAFDRERKKIKYNDKFDETFFLSPTSPQRAVIKKGDLLRSLKALDEKSMGEGLETGER